MRHPSPLRLLAPLLLLPAAALAQTQSADIELVRPTLAAGAPHGLYGARWADPGTLRVGLIGQYTRNPLVVEQRGFDEQQVIAHRGTAQLGASYDATDRFTLRASLPVVTQWGGTARDFSADGIGAGDLIGGVGVLAVQTGRFALALHGDLALPSGSRDAWLGEAGARVQGMVSTTLGVGPVDFIADAGAVARTPVFTGAGVTLGSEALLGGGLRATLVPRLLATGALLAHLPLVEPATAPLEALLGARLQATPALSFDAAGGHGLTQGIGATDARVLAGATWHFLPPPVEPEYRPEPTVSDAPVELGPWLVDKADADPAEVRIVKVPEAWDEEQLARISEEVTHIEIRDPIQFRVGTAEILPPSRPILDQVAELLRTHRTILQLVIIGHASEEGDFGTNYALALSRAVAVFEDLVEAGIHPDRLSVRSMGEVQPASTGSDEAALATNRRVEFRIARLLHRGEQPPTYEPLDRLPWSGTEVQP